MGANDHLHTQRKTQNHHGELFGHARPAMQSHNTSVQIFTCRLQRIPNGDQLGKPEKQTHKQ